MSAVATNGSEMQNVDAHKGDSALAIIVDMDCAQMVTPAKGTILRKNRRTIDIDRKSTRLNSSHIPLSRMPSSA